MKTETVVVGALMWAVVTWLLFTHWEWGVSVLLIMILIGGHQGRRS